MSAGMARGMVEAVHRFSFHVWLSPVFCRPPYAEQKSEEIGDGVIARLNPETGEIENLEVLFFSTRPLRSDLLELPVLADLRLAPKG